MKKYKKSPTKLLQIRLSEKEQKEVLEFMNKFGVSHREFILSVVNELREDKVIRENRFWLSDMYFAHANAHRYDKQFDEDSKCEECGAGHPKEQEKMQKQLERHHYLGYEGENAFRVKILCRPCHNKVKKK